MSHGISARSTRRTLAAGLLVIAGCTSQTAPDRTADPVRGPAVAEVQSFGTLEVRGVPDIPPALTERMQQYRNTRSARFGGWLGDRVLIGTRFGDTEQAHLVDRPLGARRQLTFFAEPLAEAAVPARADARGFVYARDVGGSEFYQLFWFDLAEGTSRLLTDGKSRYINARWSRAADKLAYTTTERNGRDWDIHLQDLATGATTAVLEADDAGWLVEDFSPDDGRLLAYRYVSANEAYIYELDLGSGELTPLLDGVTAAIGNARYTPDGRGVVFSSDMGAEFLRLHRLDLASGEVELLTADIAWDVEAFEFSPTGEHLAFAVNEDGYSRLYVWQWPSRARLALPEMPNGIVADLRFHPDGGRLGFTLSLPTAPDDVYSIDLEARALTRWTESEVGGLDPDGFVEPELIAYPTFDTANGVQRRIPAFVYRPDGPGPHPVYVSIHGGPEAQYRPYFSAALQYYAKELGMAVVVPNVRGSAGYGKTYLKLDNAERREDSVRDIGALLDWVGTQRDLDAERVVVSGGSYGGYMVLASLVHYSDRLVAGIERVGISNFVSFLTNTEDYRRDLRRAEYGDERDPEMRAILERISPLNNVERITRPLLITQGANDPRVPASESEQIYAALEGRGVPVWYVLALDEGHGFRKKSNSDYAAAATVLFLQRFALAGE